MTLAMAWVRTVATSEELVFASDSRLRFGAAWDACQKVFPLPRGDCAITFAGDAQFAYPFVHAAINAVSLHRGSLSRRVDVTEVVPVLLRAINSMLEDLSDLPIGMDQLREPDLRLLFGGYSWRRKRFAIWKFHFNRGERAFRQVPIVPWRGLGTQRRLVVIGNPEASLSAQRRASRHGVAGPLPEDDVQRLAKAQLINLLDTRGMTHGVGFDMEPLEVLRNIIRNDVSPHVGGPPQVLKIYQHMNSQVFGIRWPSLADRVAVLGRSLPRGEMMHVPVLDPDTLETVP